MSDLLRIKRGNKSDLPQLMQGEMGYCLDTEELFVGGTNGNNLVNAPMALNGVRPSVMYYAGDQVRISARQIALNGFRFRGQPTRQTKTVVENDPSTVIGLSTNLGAESTMKNECWYAIFCVKNKGQAPAFKVMPFLRASSVVGNAFHFGKGGERSTTYIKTAPDVQTHDFANNELVGCDVLVVTENIGGRAGQHSGRLTKVTTNTNGMVSLENIGSIQAGDYILIAPPLYEEYGYLASVYRDIGELRNISDSGSVVKAYMIYLASDAGNGSFPIDGDLSAKVTLDFRGFIAPLASAVEISVQQSFSTTATGETAVYVDSDTGNHTIYTAYAWKGNPSSQTLVHDGIHAPFTFGQSLVVSTAGLTTSATRKIEVKGWTEL